MSEVTEIINDFTFVKRLPTELLYNIFQYLTAKELIECRQVCTRWKSVIDSIADSDVLWSNFCRRDFNVCSSIARLKANHDLSWYNLYKSLYLWPKLDTAVENCDEFASAVRLNDEIRSVDVLTNGTLSVHRKSGIEYYNTDTLKMCMRSPIKGDYPRYTENDNIIVIQSFYCHLFIIIKSIHSSGQEYNYTFDNVKMFLLTDTDLFFVKVNDEIYVCDIREDFITSQFIKRTEDRDGVMSLGYTNGCLNVLTYQRNIYTINNNNNMVFKQSLNAEHNLLNVLHKYNFLEQLDWRAYFQWMCVLHQPVPKGPMGNIIVIRPYGDVFFVGTYYGALCIFYKPYTNGELDIFNTRPIRQVNFMERSDIPVLTTCPILQIDVVEIENGHMVFVAMPKKVAVLKYTHLFTQTPSWPLLPHNELEYYDV